MNLLQDIITYVRRIIKTPSNSSITDGLIIDYINRFYICDVPARIQLFDLKTKFNLELRPYIDQYTMPYTPEQSYTIGAETFTIEPYPIYQGFQAPIYIDGIQVNLMTSRDNFFKTYPNFVYNQQVETGDGTTVSFSFTTPYIPIVRAHLDRVGIEANQNGQIVPQSSLNSAVYVNALDANNNPIILFDSPVPFDYLNGTTLWAPPFSLSNGFTGYLIYYNYNTPTAPYTAAGTVNYVTGAFSATFPSAPGSDQPVNVQLTSQSAGTPRITMFWNNILFVRPIPDRVYLLEADAYLTPAAFLDTDQAFQWGYMSDYIARGAARRILSDVGDMEQLQMYEPFFREQEMQVLRRSDRITTQNRTPTIFTELLTQAPWQFSGQQST